MHIPSLHEKPALSTRYVCLYVSIQTKLKVNYYQCTYTSYTASTRTVYIFELKLIKQTSLVSSNNNAERLLMVLSCIVSCTTHIYPILSTKGFVITVVR